MIEDVPRIELPMKDSLLSSSELELARRLRRISRPSSGLMFYADPSYLLTEKPKTWSMTAEEWKERVRVRHEHAEKRILRYLKAVQKALDG
jgi:hypothetical protein